jgi:hypothetical protein
MRFGLSDLDELPSLKEFEQLAQAALGSDAGIAPTESETEVEGQSESAPTSEADGPQEANVAPARPGDARGGLSPASSVKVDAREQSIESASADISGEQSAEAESVESDPARAKGTSA